MRKDFGKKTVVTPLPVLIVGTYDGQRVPNAMNVAWGGQCSDHHVALNLGHVRKTRDNIELNKAFTVSFATVDTMAAADFVGIVSGKTTPLKMERTRWHASPSAHVEAPIFDELPLTLECKLHSIEETDTDEIRVVGEVVNMSADERILDENGRIDLGLLRPIMFDSAALTYRAIGDVVGNAFQCGKELK